MRAIDPLIDKLAILTSHLSHPAEKGRLAELVISQWLTAFLPKKYSVSTGFVAAIDEEKKTLISPQRDIIIYDELHCSPIWKTDVGGLFPIESVYATIEVKTKLKKGSIKNESGLYKSFLDAKILNSFGNYKSYFCQSPVSRENGVQFFEDKGRIPPRNYIIGFDAEFSTINKLVDAVTEVVCSNDKYDTHCHGILILKNGKDWLVRRPNGNSPEAKAGVKCAAIEGSGWQRFCEDLLFELESMDVNERLHLAGHVANKLWYPIV